MLLRQQYQELQMERDFESGVVVTNTATISTNTQGSRVGFFSSLMRSMSRKARVDDDRSDLDVAIIRY